MYNPPPMPIRTPLAALVLSTLALSAACEKPAATQAGTPVDTAARERFAREGKAAFEQLGAGDFTVEEFRAGVVKPVVFVDDFDFHSRYQALDADCRIKWLRDVTVKSIGELQKRVGAPDWTVDESEAGLERLSALGEGLHKAGTVETRSLSAMFLDLEPGFRFAGLDHPR